MSMDACRTMCAVAALLPALILAPALTVLAPSAHAQAVRTQSPPLPLPRPGTPGHTRDRKGRNEPPPIAAVPSPQLPPRAAFTAAEDAAAVVPGIPEARFWADSVAEFTNALPSKPGPWLILSSGGEDGAFGAGLLNGLNASGKRPEYSVVTGVSAGSLIAPFAFAGSAYDDALRDAFTKITAADIFELGATPESFVDTWPLKQLLTKEVTPALLADIAAQHRAGRRLFIITTNLDAQRSVIWNMGAIAAHGGDEALNLFRSVLLASSSVPGAFPPVLIDVEANGKHFAEMHVDGGVGGQFFVAPAALMSAMSDYRLPATQLYIVLNSGLEPSFEVVPQSTPSILAQSVGMAVQVDTRFMVDRAFMLAKRSNVGFNVASIPPAFNTPSRGPFDPDYMKALFQTGYDLGNSATPFSAEPPRYSGSSAPQSVDPEKAGATR
jgi:predicted acylesterase/phospholipase RssA